MKVWADANYEEESYEDLVKRLNHRKNQVAQSSHAQLDGNPLDELTLHGGLGLVGSNFYWRQGSQSRSFNMSGFELSGGVDLFSENLVAEGAIRNFGSNTNGNETDSFRELDLKALYRKPSRGQELGFRAGMGLATRYFSIRNGNFSVDEINPAMIFFGGIETNFSRMGGFGLEIGYRSVIANNSADQSSLDLMMRLDGYF